MSKLLQKLFILGISIYTTLSLLLYFNSYAFGFNINSKSHLFQSIVPDRYTCYDGCNHCSFHILKFGLFYGSINASCSLSGCSSNSYKKEYHLCIKNWMKSKRLDYRRLPEFTNYCLNDYRNITYLERQKQTTLKKFTIANAQSMKHTALALSQGIEGCTTIYNWLKQENQFSDRESLKLATFMRIRGELNSNNRLTRYFTKEDIIKLKEIFEYLNLNRDLFRQIISDTMIQQFKEEYNLMINSSLETIKPPDDF